MIAAWTPAPIVVPLLVAAVLAAVGKTLPRLARDVVAALAAAASAVVCALLARASVADPIVYWFGGWTPRAGVAIGISFVVEPLGAGLAALSGVLVAAALVFAFRFFDDVRALFHVLMLVFLAALTGFCLTGDLFNLFVFFELMSATAFALCGYKSDDPGPLQGALNFGVTNTIGAFLVLDGLALLYARTGALNMAQIGRALGGAHDGLVVAAFVLVASGFFVKAAVVPLHFWLPDAHAVAPTPVSVVFSGVMVEAALYAVARTYYAIFAGGFGAYAHGARGLMVGAGALTAIVGAGMCFAQRHLKRLLAFSTIAHVGVMLAGFGLFDARALGGVAVYVLGHGLVKGSLFLTAGIYLHGLRSVDEVALRGRGRAVPGALFFVGGVALAGAPPFATFFGEDAILGGARGGLHTFLSVLFAIASIATAGAVLRAAARITFGWGPSREASRSGGETTETPETPPSKPVPASMALASAALLVLAIAAGAWRAIAHGAEASALRFADSAAYAARVLDGASAPAGVAEPHATSLGAFLRGAMLPLLSAAIAAFALFRERLPERFRRAARRASDRWLSPIRALQSGHVGEYVTWLTVGVACFGGLCAALLR